MSSEPAIEPVEPSIPDFTLLRRIGGGGYGDVWLGRSVTGVLRAIKIISRARFEDERPFFRELDGITRFQQAVGDRPRQLALLHVGRDDRAGLFYYVMELADDAAGSSVIDPATYVPLTLKELRVRRQALPAEDCVRIGAELATALGELHQAGLLHRDVKPSNVILVDGHAKLADIGLIASSDYTVSSIGTPEYAAPEGTGSVRADLYSLGKVLYELSTGLRPEEFPRLPASLPDRPDAAALVELNEIVLRACHTEPAQRYPTAEAMLSDLRLLQAGRSVQELNRTRRQLRKLSWVGAIAGAVGLVAIAVLGVKNYVALRALAAQEATFRQAAEANERLARYTSDLHFAQLALSGGDIGGTRVALRRQIPAADPQDDLRGLEWNALWNESRGDAVRVFGEVGGPPATALALAADGRAAMIIERAAPNRAVLMDLETGARRVIAEDCYGLAAFDSTSGRLVVTTRDHFVQTIDLATGRREPQAGQGILLARSADLRRLLLAAPAPNNHRLLVWDSAAAACELEWTVDSRHARAIVSRAAATRDGSRIGVSVYWEDGGDSGYELVICDPRQPASALRIAGLPWIGRICFSPDGRQVAVATTLQVWLFDVGTTTPRLRFDAGSDINAMEFSPDGSRLAAAGEAGMLMLWSTRDGATLGTFKGHEAAVLALEWSTDGRRLITGSLDGTCRVWEPDRILGTNTLSGLWSGGLGSVVLSSRGTQLAVTNGDGHVLLLDTLGLRPQRVLAEVFHPLAFGDADQTLIALTADMKLRRVRISDGAIVGDAGPQAADALVTAFGVSANRRFAVLGQVTGEVRAWELASRKDLGVVLRTPGPSRAVAISNDGTVAAASDGEAQLHVVRSQDLTEVPTHNTVVTSLALSGDGRLLVGGTETGRLIVWQTGAVTPTIQLQAHSANIESMVFNHDESRLLSGGADGRIIVWLTSTWRWLAAWSIDLGGPNAQHYVYRLETEDSGSWLAALTDKGDIQRWDCRPPALAASDHLPGLRITE